MLQFLSTLSLRRATSDPKQIENFVFISIHALLAESDDCLLGRVADGHDFYPRSPCGERPDPFRLVGQGRDFYPRSPCGERRRAKTITAEISNFYPRSPCGERPARPTANNATTKFLSTLSLRRATIPANYDATSAKFLSTLSLRRATAAVWPQPPAIPISIHALLAESDREKPCGVPSIAHFYPRSPCGERPSVSAHRQTVSDFYPRSPCGERRRRGVTCYLDNIISIHALLAESDASQTGQSA